MWWSVKVSSPAETAFLSSGAVIVKSSSEVPMASEPTVLSSVKNETENVVSVKFVILTCLGVVSGAARGAKIPAPLPRKTTPTTERATRY